MTPVLTLEQPSHGFNIRKLGANREQTERIPQ